MASALSTTTALAARVARPVAGLRVLPLRTPTLPPATHTNTSLVGQRRGWLVDPATPHGDERALLLAFAEEAVADGVTLAGVVLTHHHPDHVGAAAFLRQALGLEVWAHPRTAELLAGRLAVDRPLEEGDVLDGGGGAGDRWQVLHTPGHASGHVVLWEAEGRSLVAGDMVAAVGTIVVEPPDGHMATYIAQLERLRTLGAARLVPAHGEMITDPTGHLDHYVRHRLMREARVLAALEAGPQPLLQVTARSYPELPAAMHPLAARSALAHLIKLQEEGRAAEGPDGAWRSVPAGA